MVTRDIPQWGHPVLEKEVDCQRSHGHPSHVIPERQAAGLFRHKVWTR